MATRLVAAAVVLLGASALLGCTTSPSHASNDVAPAPTASPNVHLYLSNQTSEYTWDHVVLTVYVDGALTVRRSMKSVFADPCAPHGNPDEVPLCLDPGPHTIRVVAEGTTASAEAQVVVGSAPVHVNAAFFYGTDCLREDSPPTARVTIHVSPRRPGFC